VVSLRMNAVPHQLTPVKSRRCFLMCSRFTPTSLRRQAATVDRHAASKVKTTSSQRRTKKIQQRSSSADELTAARMSTQARIDELHYRAYPLR
jgi:hypothetical protein